LIDSQGALIPLGSVDVNTGHFIPVSDIDFPGGDSTIGMTGWLTASADVSQYSGSNEPLTLIIRFELNDAGDTIYDSVVLIDAIRFNTVTLNAVVVEGTDADTERIAKDVARANEIWAQAGLLIRLRGVSYINQPALLDVALNGSTCADAAAGDELSQLTQLARSSIPSDINVYYVRSITGARGLGLGANCQMANDRAAMVVAELGFLDDKLTVPHEIGHVLGLPHVSQTCNIMHGPTENCSTGLERSQSSDVHNMGLAFMSDQ
jgi:hypothetical protein